MQYSLVLRLFKDDRQVPSQKISKSPLPRPIFQVSWLMAMDFHRALNHLATHGHKWAVYVYLDAVFNASLEFS